ncbi:hypothetical protein GCM10010404_74070 [Nonomuraea africana]
MELMTTYSNTAQQVEDLRSALQSSLIVSRAKVLRARLAVAPWAPHQRPQLAVAGTARASLCHRDRVDLADGGAVRGQVLCLIEGIQARPGC